MAGRLELVSYDQLRARGTDMGQFTVQMMKAQKQMQRLNEQLVREGWIETSPGEFISPGLRGEHDMATRYRNGVKQPALTKRAVEDLLYWYRQRTKTTSHGGSTYEMTIRALEALIDYGPARGRARAGLSEALEDEEAIPLTERQAQMLHLIKRNRDLVNPTTAANRKLIEGLIENGTLSAWREVTVAGERALKHFTAVAGRE